MEFELLNSARYQVHGASGVVKCARTTNWAPGSGGEVQGASGSPNDVPPLAVAAADVDQAESSKLLVLKPVGRGSLLEPFHNDSTFAVAWTDWKY